MSAPRLFHRAKDSVAHIDFLHYPGVITTSVRETDSEIEAEAEVSDPLVECPHPECGAKGQLRGNGTEVQKFRDLPRGTVPVSVSFRKQIYLCGVCGRLCGRDLPFLPRAKSQVAPRLELHIQYLLSDGIPNTRIAGWTGLDERTIRNIELRANAARTSVNTTRVTSGFIGLDDWKHGNLAKMRGILTDPVNRMPIDLLKSVKETHLADELGRYLAQHPEVKVIVIDMSRAFRSILQKHFPQLVIVVDQFHLKQALEKCVSRIFDALSESMTPPPVSVATKRDLFDESVANSSAREENTRQKKNRFKKLFRRYRRVWMKKPENRTESDRNLINAWSATFPQLAEILQRRDDFYMMWDATTSGEDFRAGFARWEQSFSPTISALYTPFVQMCHRWIEEIAAYFGYPELPTNGFTEEMVNEIKHWNRRGRGVSFEVLRARFGNYVPLHQKMDNTTSVARKAIASEDLSSNPNQSRACPQYSEQMTLPLIQYERHA